MKRIFLAAAAATLICFPFAMPGRALIAVTNGLPANPTLTLLSAGPLLSALYCSGTGSGDGVYVSTNGGFDWTRSSALPGSPQAASGLLVWSNLVLVGRSSPNDPTNTLACSRDAGKTWSGANGFPASTSINLLASDDVSLFAGTVNGGTVWRSTDQGASWTQIATSAGSFSNGTLRALGGHGGRLIAATTQGLFLLSGSGTDWTRTSTEGNAVANSHLAWQNGRLILLNGQLNRRGLALPDGSTGWVAANNGFKEGYLNLGTYFDLAAGSAGVFASSQLLNTAIAYEGWIFQSTDAGANWTALPKLPTGQVAQSMAVVSNNLLLAVSGTSPGLYRVQLVNGLPVFPPLISVQPAPIGVHSGSTATLSVSATGQGPLSYQWLQNGSALDGRTSSTLSIPNASPADAGSYSVLVSNLGGGVVSTAVPLVVATDAPGQPRFDFNPGYFCSDSGGVLHGALVNDVAALSNNQILVAGGFTHVNGIADISMAGLITNATRMGGVARLNPDGTADTSFQANPGVASGGVVLTVVPLADGKIMLGGIFNAYNGVPATNLVRLNANGSLDTSFACNNFFGGAQVQKVRAQSDGKIIVTGNISAVNGVARGGIARFNNDGTLDTTWAPNAGGSVNDVLVMPNDEALVGGNFFTVNGNSAGKYLALVNATGGLDTSLSSPFNNAAVELESQPGGLTWVYGYFTTYGSTQVSHLVRVSASGALVDSCAGAGVPAFQTLSSQKDGRLLLSTYGGPSLGYYLLRYNADGTPDTAFQNGAQFDNQVGGIAAVPAGDIYAAGYFAHSYGLPVSGLAKFSGGGPNGAPTVPFFTLQPQSIGLSPGSHTTLRVAVAGAGPITLTWIFNQNIVLLGETNSTLSLSNFAAGSVGEYRVIASNAGGSVTSAVASVVFAIPPSITQQPPAAAGATNGGSVLLSVTASGPPPLSYQWTRYGSPVGAATASSFLITNLSSSLIGDWRVVVSNNFGSVTSAVCAVQLGVAPGIQTQPAGSTLNGPGNVLLSVTPTPASSLPLTYIWYQNGFRVAALAVNQFILTNAVPTNAGAYQVVISNFAGAATSAVVTVVIRNPVIVQNPSLRTAVEGGSTNFTVSVAGTAPLDVSWFRRSTAAPAVTNNLGTGTNLLLSAITRADGKFFYYAIVSNIWGSATSQVASLIVQGPPVITNITSTNLISEINGSASAQVQFDSQPTPKFTWFQDGVLRTNFQDNYLFLSSVQASDAGSYQLVLSNAFGSVTSAPIVLTVKAARGPTITTQPNTPTIVAVGTALSLGVEVDGTPFLQYRWYRASTPVTDWKNDSSYYVATASLTNSGNYFVVVTNLYGAATSAVCVVTVQQPQPAVYGSRHFVRIADSTQQIPQLGTNLYDSFQDGYLRNGEVWFGGGIAGVPFSGGVYHWSNGSVASLVDTNQNIPGGAGKFTQFYGSTYLSAGQVVFAGRGNGEQNGLYAWTNGSIVRLFDTNTLCPGSDNILAFGWPRVSGNQLAFLTRQGASTRSLALVSNGVLSVLADSNSVLPGLGKWAASSAEVGFDGDQVGWWALNQDGRGGIFTVGRDSLVTSVASVLTINPYASSEFTDFISPPDVVKGRVYFRGTTQGSGIRSAFYYSDGAGAQPIIKSGDPAPGRGIPLYYVGYPGISGTDQGAFFGATDGRGYSGLFFWNGTNSIKVVDSLDSLDGQGISSLAVQNCEGDDILFSVVFQNNVRALYVTSRGAVSATPNILTQPQSQNVPVGSNVTFSVIAEATSALGYQWQFNTQNISQETNSTLSLPAVTASKSGNYRVVVTASGTSVTSTTAVLTVYSPVHVTSGPASQTVTPGARVTLSATATGTAPLRYQWQLNENPLPGKTNATLVLASAVPEDSGSYRVVVSNANGQDASDPATVLVVPPAPVVTSPTPRTFTTNDGALLIHGTASTSAGVTRVEWSLNGGAVQLASGTTSWTATLSMMAGTNNFVVWAENVHGQSTRVTNRYVFVQTPAISIQINGPGRVSPIVNGQLLSVSKTYSITAIPAANQLFSNWVGGTSQPFAVLGTNPALSFVMQSNLVLQANFVSNLFLSAQGSYHGLFGPNSEARGQLNSGSFNFILTSAGVFSGRLTLGADSPALNGKFSVGGRSTVVVARAGKPSLTVALQLDGAAQQVLGTVSDGSFTVSLVGDRAVFSAARPATAFAGQYDVTIPGVADAGIGPEGTSVGTLSIDTLGNVTLAAALADGTVVSPATVLSKDGYWPLYLPLYGSQGSIWTWALVTNHAVVAAPELSWIKPGGATSTGLYREGFTNHHVALTSSTFLAGNRPLLGLTNATVILSGGDLAVPITNHVAVSSAGVITVLENSNKLTLVVSKTTGKITGSFANPTRPQQLFQVNAVLLQDQSIATGFFSGTNRSGTFLLR